MTVERLFADTNLFLRYITNDVPKQAQAFEALLKRAGRGELHFVTHPLVIAEIVWTLESYFGLPKEDIMNKVLAILNTPGLEVSDNEIVLQAILWYVEKNVDFIDAYSAAWMFRRDIRKACSFNSKHFGRFEGVETWIPGERD